MRGRGLIAACAVAACLQGLVPGLALARAEPSGFHAVRPGENLSSIAKRNRVTVGQLREWNGITGDLIHPGQKLRVMPPRRAARNHRVRRGDTLSGIAAAYGTTVAALRSANGLRGSRILVGQTLVVPGLGLTAPIVYRVRRGDTLSGIASDHGVTLSSLRRANGIAGSRIYPGQELRIPGAGLPRLSAIPWDELYAGPSGPARFDLPNGPYFGRRPLADFQKSRHYREGSSLGPVQAYRRGVRLLAGFDRELDRLGRLGDGLAGWHFVLDPGHGGEDPGAITPVRDGNGRTRYVVEDEYVYDVMMRVYALLRLHAATVTTTVISPNHLVRRSDATFVHERNEVFHDETWNRKGPSAWPRGGSASLSARVEVARRALRGAPADRTVFLSFHADNDPDSPAAPLVLYPRGHDRASAESRRFAAALAGHLGRNAGTRARSLHVLRNNPAAWKVMVEVRNMAYDGEAWLLRSESGRREDARRIVDGLLAWAARVRK